jgi:hypothetical protein
MLQVRPFSRRETPAAAVFQFTIHAIRHSRLYEPRLNTIQHSLLRHTDASDNLEQELRLLIKKKAVGSTSIRAAVSSLIRRSVCGNDVVLSGLAGDFCSAKTS